MKLIRKSPAVSMKGTHVENGRLFVVVNEYLSNLNLVEGVLFSRTIEACIIR